MFEEQLALKPSSMEVCILLDIDHFHPFVKSQGPNTGQLILSECLAWLGENSTSRKTVNYGRDEFMIITLVQGVEEAIFFAEGIRRQLVDVVLMPACKKFARQSWQLGCSTGVALSPIHATDAKTLIRKS
jgi:GGDEF domain-containing protein